MYPLYTTTDPLKARFKCTNHPDQNFHPVYTVIRYIRIRYMRGSLYISLRKDGSKGPFNKYSGPHEVVQTGRKTFIVQIGTRRETVITDRLVPAHLDIDETVTVQKPSGRARPPKPRTPTSPPVPDSSHQSSPQTVLTRSGRIINQPHWYRVTQNGCNPYKCLPFLQLIMELLYFLYTLIGFDNNSVLKICPTL